jgi:hypothetical protein
MPGTFDMHQRRKGLGILVLYLVLKTGSPDRQKLGRLVSTAQTPRRREPAACAATAIHPLFNFLEVY